MNRSTENWIHR